MTEINNIDLQNNIIEILKINNENITKTIELRNNPNPIYITCIIIGYFAVIYFLYIFLIKDDISGKWKDSDENIYNILHNKFTDNIIIYKTNKIQNIKDKKILGSLCGNLLIIKGNKVDNTGIYLNGRIKWLDNKIWYKISC